MEFVQDKSNQRFLLKISRDIAQYALDTIDHNAADREISLNKILIIFSKNNLIEATSRNLIGNYGGCFVTYRNKRKNNQLRGCIGIFESAEPLYKVVLARSLDTLSDPRFQHLPITSREFKTEIEIEISVLTPPVNTANPLETVKLGTHGVSVRYGNQRGTYLPQVAIENGGFPDVKTFLMHLATRKAGINTKDIDIFHDPRVIWETYTAVVFAE